MNLGSVHGFVHGSVYGLVHGLVYGTWFMVHGVLNNVLLEHGGLPFIFPFKVHLDFGHHCITQWYLRLLWWNTLCSSLCCPPKLETPS